MRQHTKLSSLTLAALGVVFGDIGTSPLYTIKEIFIAGSHPLGLSQLTVFGILSLITWALVLVVSIKYVAFIMRADNQGEGGIMALLALASSTAKHNLNKQRLIMYLGILGACMFYADGVITPAISVLSAVEGLEVVTPQLHALIVPITLIVLFILFWTQSKGTATVGALFGPVMLLWFIVIGVLGIRGILISPTILHALNPMYAWQFLSISPSIAFIALGGVVLAVTGAEALYADMGHFGRKPIRMAWFFVAFPSLILNYLGQGALILDEVTAIQNPFYRLAPDWFLLPLIVLATLATVIASQAVITGAFSISRQALQLGYLPRMHVEHTSESREGQIYMPRINLGLMIAVMLLVISFGSSGSLASAYGIAVTGNMAITTLLASVVFHQLWGWGWGKTLLLVGVFLSVDLAFLSANILKVPDGGWVPLALGAILFTLMLTWKSGRQLLYLQLKNESVSLSKFLSGLDEHPPMRVTGSAVFMTPNPEGVPHALLHNLRHNKVLHDKVVILTVCFLDVPHTPKQKRLVIQVLPHNFYQVTLNYGFKDQPDLAKDIELGATQGLILDPRDTSFFIGKEILIASKKPNMMFWRKKVFIGLFRSTETMTNQFRLPPNRVVELGSQVSF